MLNKVIVVEVLVAIALFVIMEIVEICVDNVYGSYLTRNMTKAEAKKEVQRLYQEGEYERMSEIYYDAVLSDSGIEKEASMASFYLWYGNFNEEKVAYISAAMDDDIDDATINRLLNDINNVLESKEKLYENAYDEANREEFEKCREDVKAFCKGVLKLTDEEIAEISAEIYLDDEIEKKYRKIIKARRSSAYEY